MKTIEEGTPKNLNETETIGNKNILKVNSKCFSTKEDYTIILENQEDFLKISLIKKGSNSVKHKAKYSYDFLKKYKLFSEDCKNINDIYAKLYNSILERDKIQIILEKKNEQMHLVLKELKKYEFVNLKDERETKKANNVDADKIILYFKNNENKNTLNDKSEDISDVSDDIQTKDISKSFSYSNNNNTVSIFKKVNKNNKTILLGKKRDNNKGQKWDNKNNIKYKNEISNSNNNILIYPATINSNSPAPDPLGSNDKKNESVISISDDKESVNINVSAIDISHLSNKSVKTRKILRNVFITHFKELDGERKINIKQLEKEKIETDFKLSLERAKIIRENKEKEKDRITPRDDCSLSVNNNNDISINSNLKYYNLEKNDLLKSKIVKNEAEINLLLFGIKEINKNVEASNMKYISLIYNSKEDGGSSLIFHKKCDYSKDLLIIIKTNENYIFGGFTKKYFDSENSSKKIDKNSFIFSIDKMKIYYAIENGSEENSPGILSQAGYGPSFLNNAISLGKNLINDIGQVGKKECGYDIKTDFEINFGKEYFSACNVEIYQVIFDKYYVIQ